MRTSRVVPQFETYALFINFMGYGGLKRSGFEKTFPQSEQEDHSVDNFGTMVGENPTNNGILA